MASQVTTPLGSGEPISLSTLAGRILQVGDFAPWRRSLCTRLEAHKHLEIVGEATDGLEAVQKAQELNPDLVLLDIGLPNLKGIEAAHRIGELVPKAKILFVTQNDDADVVKAALNNGAHGYIWKVDAGPELLAGIEAVLRGQRFVSRRLKEPK